MIHEATLHPVALENHILSLMLKQNRHTFLDALVKYTWKNRTDKLLRQLQLQQKPQQPLLRTKQLQLQQKFQQQLIAMKQLQPASAIRFRMITQFDYFRQSRRMKKLSVICFQNGKLRIYIYFYFYFHINLWTNRTNQIFSDDHQVAFFFSSYKFQINGLVLTVWGLFQKFY